MISSVLLALAACTFVSADAPASSDSRGQERLVAVFTGSANGAIKFVPFDKDSTVYIPSHVHNLPNQGQPFSYSIRQGRVGADGSCANTGDMFDPYSGSTSASSNAGKPVGDLSGKFGTVDRQYLDENNHDSYISLNPDNKAYIGNKLVVFFDKNGKAIACANISLDNDNDSDSDDDSDDDENHRSQSRNDNQRNGNQWSTYSTRKTSSIRGSSLTSTDTPSRGTSQTASSKSTDPASVAADAASSSTTSGISSSTRSNIESSSSSRSSAGAQQATGMGFAAVFIAAFL